MGTSYTHSMREMLRKELSREVSRQRDIAMEMAGIIVNAVDESGNPVIRYADKAEMDALVSAYKEAETNINFLTNVTK